VRHGAKPGEVVGDGTDRVRAPARERARPLTDPAPSFRTAAEPRLRFLIPLVVGCAFFMEGLDSTSVATSIPAMARDLGEEPLRLSLLVTAYLLSLAVFIPVSGWFADRFGTRRVFCAALAIFATASAVCGCLDSLAPLVAMRVLQGFGGALMTPVGRLILLRSFPRSGLVSAMNWMTIPAMVGPTMGPIIAGSLTTYASWRWIFFLNLPIAIAGIAATLRLIDDVRAEAPDRFDFTGFAIAGLGLALLESGLENLGRPVLPTVVGLAFFPAAVAFLLLYRWYAQRRPNAAVDLSLLRLRTFRIGTLAGGPCRMALDAVPFLLPLLFQVGFGLSAVQSGLLTFSSSLGAMLVRTLSRRLFRALGFRRILVSHACLAAALTASFALLRPGTPHGIVVLCILASGCLRSILYLGLNTLSYADVPTAVLSKATSLGGVAQQLARGFGVATGAALLALVVGSRPSITIADFDTVFVLLAVVPVFAALGFLRLAPQDGAEVSGHGKRVAAS
jgi:EmrB/QacA subfamily drug resistance transporter